MATIDYKEKYEQALEVAQRFYNNCVAITKKGLEDIFPELKESEDERIRNLLYCLIRDRSDNWKLLEHNGVSVDMALAWLEKQKHNKFIVEDAYQRGYDKGVKDTLENQSENQKEHNICDTCDYNGSCIIPCHAKLIGKQVVQKPADKVKPKFKVGDWVVNEFGHLKHIINIKNDCYYAEGEHVEWHGTFEYGDTHFRLWTIQDAKDGDVLADGNLPFIFKKIDANKYSYAYCGISTDDGFKIESDGEFGEWTWTQDIKPATKEQRDTLMKAMADAGYIFDFEKKELKKIEQKPAKEYSFNIESELFHQLTPAQQGLWKKEIEQAYNAGADTQKSAEWSEEDEHIINDIIDKINRIKNGCIEGGMQKKICKKEVNWLKSIRPQWKPSEEMLEALYRAIPENTMAISEDEMLLDKLYQGLKYGRVLSNK